MKKRLTLRQRFSLIQAAFLLLNVKFKCETFKGGLCGFRSSSTFSVISVTQADMISCAFCFMNFYLPGPCCLPPPLRNLASSALSPPKPWLILTWAPQRLGRSLRPSEPHTPSQSKAGAIWGTSDPWDVWERVEQWIWLTCWLPYTICYAPTSLFLKFRESTTPAVTEALPGTRKTRNKKEGNRKEPKGLLGKVSLLELILTFKRIKSPWS